jgi:putative transposase
MIFSFIQEHQEVWPIRLMCDTLEVSTAGFYAWRSRPTSEQQQRRDAILEKIGTIHAEFKQRYGSPRIHAELKARGIPCCVNTVARLMQDNDIQAKTRRKFLTLPDCGCSSATPE